MLSDITSQKFKQLHGSSRCALALIATAILLLNFSAAHAQTCASGIDGLISLSSQQQVSDFQADYGPCDIVAESLLVSGSNISSLTPLSGLVEVQGSLFIRDNPQLQSLLGLSNLKRTGSFLLERNDDLPNLEGLTGLAEVGSLFKIYANNGLRTLDGISPSVAFNHYLDISSNAVLDNIFGLATSNMPYPSSVTIKNNSKLRSLAGLPTIEQLTKLEISANGRLRTLEGIVVNNHSLDGILSIQNNPLLISLEGLEWLESVAWMTVFRNHYLTNFRGMTGLISIGKLFVEENNSLVDFTGLDQLEYIGNSPVSFTAPTFRGDFWVRSNPSLSSFSGLSSLQTIEGNLWVYNSPALTSLQGLNNVSHVGTLTISYNSALPDLDELNALHSALNISIFSNEALSNCMALEPLLDVIDHGETGPGPGEFNAPDVAGTIYFEGNPPACNSKDQIAPKPAVTKVMTGSWYSPASSGEGFMIHVVKERDPSPFRPDPGLNVGYFYGYDEQGRRFWLLGTQQGEVSWEEPVRFSAIYATGGVFESFDTTAIKEIEWGSFSFTPGSCTTGKITLSGEFADQPGIVEKTLELVRLGDVAGDYCAQQIPSAMSDSITGSWYDPATSGQGFSIHKINEQTGAVYFYGFDNDGTPLWLLGVWSSPLLAGEAVELEMNRFTGGTFSEVNPEEIVRETWGTMSLRMDDCGVAYAEMDGLDGRQIFFLQQLAGTLGLECPE